MITNKKKVVPLRRAASSLCNPIGLPHDGKVEKGDFACWPKGDAWVYFMKPKNPGQTPKTSHDGEPKFIKSMFEVRSLKISTLQEYLEILAKRHEMTVRRVNKANKNEEIWQFC